MEHTRLKDTSKIIGLVLGLAVVIIRILIDNILEPDARTENMIDGLFWTSFGLIPIFYLLKTGNRAWLTLSLFCFLVAVSYFTGYKGLYFIIAAVTLLFITFYFGITARLNWKYRNILQLAAASVDHAEDGFTSRPYPLGEINATKEELHRFGSFLSANLIAFPFQDETGLYLCINERGKHWFKRPAVDQDTYIHFPENGPVAVNIARNEYDQYKEELTFDRLCQSLGNLFVRFLDLYRKGKTEEIICIAAGR